MDVEFYLTPPVVSARRCVQTVPTIPNCALVEINLIHRVRSENMLTLHAVFPQCLSTVTGLH